MTIDEVVMQYCNEILNSKSKADTTKNIIKKIECLTDASTNEKISIDIQLEIFEKIEKILFKKQISLSEHENINYLSMLSAVRKELNKKKQNTSIREK